MKAITLLILFFSCSSTEKTSSVKTEDKYISSFDELMKECERGAAVALDSLKKDEKSAEYWGKVSNCYIEENNLAKAQLFLKLGEEINPSDSRVMEARGRIYLKQKNFKDAYGVYQECEKFQNLSSLKKLAQLENYFGNYQKSNQLLDQISRKLGEDEFKKFQLLKAKNYISLDDFKSSLRVYKRLGRYAMRKEESRYLFSYSLAKNGDVQTAKKIIEKKAPGIESEYKDLYLKVNDYINKETAKLNIEEVKHGSTSN